MAAGSVQPGSPQATVTAYAAVRSTVIVALADVDVLTTVIGTPAKARLLLTVNVVRLSHPLGPRGSSRTTVADSACTRRPVPTETQLNAGCTSAAAGVASCSGTARIARQ